jgi:L-iditol 2-dehydrogenase
LRAAVYYNNNDVRIEEVKRPKPGPGEILVKVEASGICGSDVMEWYRVKKAPLVLGHEIAGTVEETGTGVKGFKEGDRVTVSHHVPCNTCRYCLSGHHSVCETLRKTNFDPGGFAEYVRVPAINVESGTFLLPEGVSFEEGSFSEPLGCVVRGFRAVSFEPGKTVAILGSGIAGLLHVKLAKALGAAVIVATDVNDLRLDWAMKFGADLTVRADTEDVPSKVREANSGRLADIVFLCTAGDKAIAQAMESVDRAGTILFFAPMEPGSTFPIPLFDIWHNDITLKNSYASCPADTVTAIALIHDGRVSVADMITHRLSLGEAPLGFKLVSKGGESIKVIIECQR